jgi:hypothetical protein
MARVSDLDLMLQFMLQMIVILVACRVIGWVGRYLGQAQVVMEMVAGVVLGPSLFGLLAPQAQAWLFPLKVEETGARHPTGSSPPSRSARSSAIWRMGAAISSSPGSPRAPERCTWEPP